MKTLSTPRHLFIIMLMSLICNVLFGQTANTLRPGWYTLGLNAGLSYQQSDVDAHFRGIGLGITLAKNLNRRAGQFLEVDIRGRLKYAVSYGLDGNRNFLVDENTAVNGTNLWDYREYPIELGVQDGFVYNNHRSQMAELGLEGVFTLGKLRQRTGINLSLFGGIGLDWYRAKTDQGDELAQTDYKAAYAAIDSESTYAERRSMLSHDILNGTYESLGQGFENHNNGKVTLMPNWGIELGYDITPRWGIGLGHKVTYTGVDIFDGMVLPGNKNDIHHYSYLQLYYRFNVDEKEILPPTVHFIVPEYSPYMTKEPYKIVEAEIINVKDQNQISLTNNGRPLSFTYRKGKMTATIILNEGTNTVKAMATNAGGTGEDEVQIVLEEPETDDPPMIKFLRPEISNQVVNNASYDVLAEIQFMETDKNITFNLNGRDYRNWKFDMNNNMFSSPITLIEGENILILDAKNRRGSDRETIRIIYEAPVYPPSIQFITPDVSPYRTTVQSQDLELKLKEIRRSDNIQLTFNGYAFTRYDFNENTGKLTSRLALQKGQNFLTIFVSNKAGNAREDLVIILEDAPPVLEFVPRVMIQSINGPVYNSSLQDCSVSVTASVQYIKSSSQLDIRIGGRRITNFDFNPGTGIISFQTGISKGNHNLVITGRNTAGEGRDERMLSCESPPPPRPVVTIYSPANNSVHTFANINLSANVQHVNDKNDITLTVNGRKTNSFSFNPANGNLESLQILSIGQNTITISAFNQSGTDNASIKLEYKPVLLPVLSISAPANGSVTESAVTQLTGNVTNVNAANQIKVYLNGQLLGSPVLTNNQFKISANLRVGENTFRAVADNGNGQSEASINVRYEIKYEKPVITFVYPTQNTTVEEARLALKASVTNVERVDQIKLILNGRAQSVVSFDKETGMISKTLSLKIGKNTIEIEAANPAGSARNSLEVIYDPTIAATPVPEVKIESASRPVSDPFNPNAAPVSNVIATLKGVGSIGQITFTVNGAMERGFSFDAKTGKLTHQINLNKGENVIVITATNIKGTASDTTTVRL